MTDPFPSPSPNDPAAPPRAQSERPTQFRPVLAPKNIILCCDGTGNEVAGDLTNVLKLFRISRKSASQRVFYDPGVGTIGNQNAWTRLQQRAQGIFGLATGAGLDNRILEAYRFLATHFNDGDHVFLFGFSRGAYTVRVLAGLIHMVGLLEPDQLNIADYALTAYKRASEENDFHIAWDFARTVGSRRVTIHFMGLWDTVASLIVPRPDRLYLPGSAYLPYTARNPSVRTVRHAMAIDERRRMFRLNRWSDPQPFISNPFAKPPVSLPQDIQQKWFAGVHSDIGGGYAEVESALSKFPLIWMIDEAVAHGLQITEATFEHLAPRAAEATPPTSYVAADPAGTLHRSLRSFWWILEFLPKRTKWREWKRLSILGFYLPRGEPRLIDDTAQVDQSVAARRDLQISYDPVNLPKTARSASAVPNNEQKPAG